MVYKCYLRTIHTRCVCLTLCNGSDICRFVNSVVMNGSGLTGCGTDLCVCYYG